MHPDFSIEPEVDTAPVTRLLQDETTDNAALVLQLIAGGVAPQSRRIIGYLFGIAVFHYEAEVAALAYRLLAERAAAETVKQAAKLREAVPYYYNESEYLGKYENPEIDLFDFLLAYKMCHWHRQHGERTAYFITSHQSLDLTHYPYDNFTPALANLHFVRYISLPSSRAFQLENAVQWLKKLPLKTVIIEGMRLEQFPVALFELPELKILSIRRGNSRPRQPMAVPEGGPYGSPALEELVVEGYPVTGEERLGPFPALEAVTITRCRMHSIEWLRHSTRMEYLILNNNCIAEAPFFLSNFRALDTLDLSFNPLQHIHIDLGKMEFLKMLNIRVQPGHDL